MKMMIEKLPEVEGFTSSYNETANAVVFTYEPLDFHQVVPMRHLEDIERKQAWPALEVGLAAGLRKYQAQNKTGE